MNLYAVLTLLWTGLILFATLTPGDQLPDSDLFNIPYLDKVVHAGLFTVQSFLLIKSLHKLRRHGLLKNRKVILVVLVCVIFAVFVEFMQKYVPDRSYEMSDLIANILGVLLGLIAFKILNKFY